jgi:hypothetical protein
LPGQVLIGNRRRFAAREMVFAGRRMASACSDKRQQYDANEAGHHMVD